MTVPLLQGGMTTPPYNVFTYPDRLPCGRRCECPVAAAVVFVVFRGAFNSLIVIAVVVAVFASFFEAAAEACRMEKVT